MPVSRLVLVVAIAVVAIGSWSWNQRAVEAAPGVLTAAVSRANLEQTVLATGILKPAQLVATGAQVSGRITRLHVNVGQIVAQGDLIAEIDSVTQQNALRSAEAALAVNRAQLAEKELMLAQSQRVLDRQTLMFERATTATSDFEEAATAVAVIRAQINALHAQITQSEIAVETASANLAYTRIISPISGTVLAVISQEGQTVNASSATPTIAIIGRLDVMTVHAQISEADITRVYPGQSVWFSTMGDSATRHEAVLDMIEPAPASIRSDSAIDPSGSSAPGASAIYYNGTFDIANLDGSLRTYQTVQVSIVLGHAQDALTIPSAALREAGADGRWQVYVQDPDDQLEARWIRTGLNDRIRVEVLDGLREGERVVTGQAHTGAASANSRSRPMIGR